MATSTRYSNKIEKTIYNGTTPLANVSFTTTLVQTYNTGAYTPTTNKSKLDLKIVCEIEKLNPYDSLVIPTFNVSLRNYMFPSEDGYYTTTPVTAASGGTTTILNESVDFSHDNDGARKVQLNLGSVDATITVSQGIYAATGFNLGNAIKVSLVYYTRTPTITLPSMTFNNTYNIAVSSIVNGASLYCNGELIGSIAGKSGNVSYTPSGDSSVYSQYPNQAYAPYSFYATNSIGQGATKIANIQFPSSVKPSVDSVSFTDAATKPSKYDGMYIKGLSRLSGVINASAIDGSTILNYLTNTGINTYTTQTFITGILNETSYNITTQITDSRGRTDSVSNSISVQPYNNPVVYDVGGYRCDASGTQQTDGEYFRAIISYDVSSLNNLNTKSLVVKLNGSSVGSVNLTNYSATNLDLWSLVQISGVSAMGTNTITFELTDDFSTYSISYQVPIARSHIDFITNTSGEIGVGIGTSATANYFDEQLPSKVGSMVSGCCNSHLTNGQTKSFSIPTGFVGVMVGSTATLWLVFNVNGIVVNKIHDNSKLTYTTTGTLNVKANDNEYIAFIGNGSVVEQPPLVITDLTNTIWKLKATASSISDAYGLDMYIGTTTPTASSPKTHGSLYNWQNNISTTPVGSSDYYMYQGGNLNTSKFSVGEYVLVKGGADVQDSDIIDWFINNQEYVGVL